MEQSMQLSFCKRCQNREMNMARGVLCKLTGDKPNFDGECVNYKLDEELVDLTTDDTEGLNMDEVKSKLSPEIYEKLKMEQRLVPGLVAGGFVGILGAILWGIITVSTGFQIGYMALAIGAGVGFAIRKFGNGIEPIFGFCGASLSLFSCLLGNFFSIIGYLAHANGLGYLEAFTLFDYSYLPTVMIDTFSFIDLLFYGIAIYEGYRFSFRVITEKKMMEIVSEK